MSIALITSGVGRNVVNGGIGPASVTGKTTTGANCIIGVGGYYAGGGTPVLTDNKSNSYTTLTLYDEAGLPTLKLMYCISPTVGSGHDFNFDDFGTGVYAALAIGAFSGVKTVSPFDQQNGNNSSWTNSLATNSITPTDNGQLIISGATWAGDTATMTIDQGLTIIEQGDNTPDESMGIGLAWKEQATAAAIDATWTSVTNAVIMAATIASFKAALAAGGGPLTRGILTKSKLLGRLAA